MPDPSHVVWPQHHIPSPTNSLPLTEVSRVVVGGAVQAKPLQIGDQVGDHALEDALTLAQDVELSRKEVKKTRPMGQVGPTTLLLKLFTLPITHQSFLRTRDTHLVKHLKELGTGLVDGTDDGTAPLGQRFHEGYHLETGGTVQTTVQREATREWGEMGRSKRKECLGLGSYYKEDGAGRKGLLWLPLYRVHTVRFRHLEVLRSPKHCAV